jgi:glucokinase
MNLVVGIDLGGTKTAAGVVDAAGRVLMRLEAPTPALLGPWAVLEGALALARALITAHPGVRAIGIGAAGVIDQRSLRVVSATGSLPGWAGTDLGEAFGSSFGLPVSALNDVHAHAAGEVWFGAGATLPQNATTLMVAAGTGIGGALVVGGAVQPGAHFMAGHLGHVPASEAAGLPCTCGRAGHLEVVAAGPAILAAYLRETTDAAAPTDTRAVVALAEAGDPVASVVVHTAAHALGRAIGGLLNTIDPDLVVISGGLAAAGPFWWSALRKGIALESMDSVADTRVLAAALGADAAIIGAARTALDLLETQ